MREREKEKKKEKKEKRSRPRTHLLLGFTPASRFRFRGRVRKKKGVKWQTYRMVSCFLDELSLSPLSPPIGRKKEKKKRGGLFLTPHTFFYSCLRFGGKRKGGEKEGGKRERDLKTSSRLVRPRGPRPPYLGGCRREGKRKKGKGGGGGKEEEPDRGDGPGLYALTTKVWWFGGSDGIDKKEGKGEKRKGP